MRMSGAPLIQCRGARQEQAIEPHLYGAAMNEFERAELALFDPPVQAIEPARLTYAARLQLAPFGFVLSRPLSGRREARRPDAPPLGRRVRRRTLFALRCARRAARCAPSFRAPISTSTASLTNSTPRFSTGRCPSSRTPVRCASRWASARFPAWSGMRSRYIAVRCRSPKGSRGSRLSTAPTTLVSNPLTERARRRFGRAVLHRLPFHAEQRG